MRSSASFCFFSNRAKTSSQAARSSPLLDRHALAGTTTHFPNRVLLLATTCQGHHKHDEENLPHLVASFVESVSTYRVMLDQAVGSLAKRDAY